MTELKLIRDPDDNRAYVLPTFGRVRLPHTPWGEVVIEVQGAAERRVSGGKPRLHPIWQAAEPDRGAVATLEYHDRRIICGERELVMNSEGATLLKGPGPWVVSEQGREIVSFTRRDWGRRPVTVTIMDEQAIRSEPRLILLAAWSANMLSRSAGVL
jgi:hypothetical protein